MSLFLNYCVYSGLFQAWCSVIVTYIWSPEWVHSQVYGVCSWRMSELVIAFSPLSHLQVISLPGPCFFVPFFSPSSTSFPLPSSTYQCSLTPLSPLSRSFRSPGEKCCSLAFNFHWASPPEICIIRHLVCVCVWVWRPSLTMFYVTVTFLSNILSLLHCFHIHENLHMVTSFLTLRFALEFKCICMLQPVSGIADTSPLQTCVIVLSQRPL